MKLDAVVVLETMWDWRSMTSGAGYVETAPPYFTINPDNHSGRRLYQLLGEKNFVVTNACKELVSGPNHHGKIDPKWLADNLFEIKSRFGFDLLLVCGGPAWKCYLGSREIYKFPGTRVVKMKHPAARDWTKTEIERWKAFLC